MMDAVFQAPKRRPRVYEAYDAPFPVPLAAGDARLQQTIIYRADMVNQHVVVRDPEHIQALYGKGYFGKGILSRSRPDHSISQQWEKFGERVLPVISLFKYQKHLSWARDVLLAQGLEEEVVNQMLQRLCQPMEPELREENGNDDCPASPHRSEETGAGEPQDMASEQTGAGKPQDMASEQTGAGKPQDMASEQTGAGKPQDMASEQTGAGRQQDMASEQAGAGRQQGQASDSWSPEDQGEQDSQCSQAKRPRSEGDGRFDPLSELYTREPQQIDPAALTTVRCPRHDDWLVDCGCRLEDSVLETLTLQRDRQTDAGRQGADRGYEYVLVMEEEEENSVVKGRAGPGMTVRRVCRVNPFRLLEYLQLTLEEAFFLVYALGCLSVYYNEEPLSVLQLWEIFRSVQPHFETSYMAYHYFRSRGWVPKPGVKYGTDLMLYRKGPPFYHASYSVVVEKVDQPCRGGALRPFSWRSLAALSRITGNVSKDLMLCYVIYPSHLTEEQLSSPDCLCRVTVQEIILSRWISSRERTETDDI
ncbi:tRNA-splicing endonuclease subunit Sen2 isoform X2 [Salvelinus fontinalis]|uniref:tRNA-splicing endonuclease subunit Sen2 isoform X2 n=1 Tax=Salvelinus fontinalis TaxID=8038 RepID=UPI002486886E|nr:tRNA-splicing endonuclease subunit Sen2 isoform X2 [Salvelinus fontinalis]